MCRPYFKTHPDLLFVEVSEETGLPSDEIGKERTSRARFFPHLVTQLVQHDVSHHLWTPSISHLHHTRDNPEVISKRSRVIPDGASMDSYGKDGIPITKEITPTGQDLHEYQFLCIRLLH